MPNWEVHSVLLAVSAFVTGFQSVVLHARKDRASDRLDRLYEGMIEDQGEPQSLWSEELATAADDLIEHHGKLDRYFGFPGILLALNVLSLLLSSALGLWIVLEARLTLMSLTQLIVVLVIHIAIVGVAFKDEKHVSSQVQGKFIWLLARAPGSAVRAMRIRAERVERLLDLASDPSTRPWATKKVRYVLSPIAMVGLIKSADFIGRFLVEGGNEDDVAALHSQAQSLADWLHECSIWMGDLDGNPPSLPDRPEVA